MKPYDSSQSSRVGLAEPATEATDQSLGDETTQGIIATLRGRLISLRSMNRPLRLLAVIALAQIVLVTLLLATHTLPQPQVQAGLVGNLRTAQVPLAVFIVTVASLALGWTFALAGALRVHPAVRLLAVALATAALAYYPVTSLLTAADTGDSALEPFATVDHLAQAQLVVLAVIVVWALGRSLFDLLARRGNPDEPRTGRTGWRPLTFGLVLALILTYYGLQVGIWIVYDRAGFGDGFAWFSESVTQQVSLLPLVLGAVVYWSSTDFVEWGTTVAGGLAALLRRLGGPWVLAILCLGAAIAMLVNVLRRDSLATIAPSLLIMAALAVGVILLTRFARVDRTWPARPPFAALVVGAGLLFAGINLFFLLIPVVIAARHVSLPTVDAGNALGPPLIQMSILLVDLVGITIGLALAVRGRAQARGALGATGLFLVMVALLFLAADSPPILETLGVLASNPPLFLSPALEVLVAAGTLPLIVWLFARRRSLGDIMAPLAGIFLLLAGLQIINWYRDASDGLTALGAGSTAAYAGLVLLAILWDVATSGNEVTNRDTPAFPREGRVLLYFGYTLVTSALLLYAAAIRVQTPGSLDTALLSTSDESTLGLLLLGYPLLLLGFFLQFGRWYAARSPSPLAVPNAVLEPGSRSALRGLQLGILGVGALATIGVATFTFAVVAPRALAAVTPQLAPYSAAAPGPTCDSGSASWSFVQGKSSILCSASGMRLQTAANDISSVGFVPPPPSASQNYTVSTQIDVSGLAQGCAGFWAREAITGGSYASYICATGDWFLLRFPDKVLLAVGTVAGSEHQLEMTVDGANLRVAIDKVELATVSDETYPSGPMALVVNNFGDQDGVVVFHNFEFTPLPMHPVRHDATAYHAAAPGSGCDHGQAQWLLIPPSVGSSPGSTQCSPSGLRLSAQPNGRAKIVFVPPSGTFATSFQVTMRVGYTTPLSACPLIFLQGSVQDVYGGYVCPELAAILHFAASNTDLGHVAVPTAATHVIQLTKNGASLTLAVDGQTAVSVDNTTLTATSSIGFLVTGGASDGSVTFADFTYSPFQ